MALMTLGTVAEYINGRAFKPDEWEQVGKPIIRIQNLTNSSETCNRTQQTYEEKYLVKKGDLLFAWSASLGAHIWNGEDGWLNQHIFKIKPYECIEKMYLYYYLLYVVNRLYAKTHGSGMVHITLKPFKETTIPVPEISKQKRIVSIIERLFLQLDEARDKAQEALDSFDIRKSSLLQKAFSGELTEKWRKENRVSIDTWETLILDSVCESIYDGDHMPPPKSESGIPFLMISNVNDGYLSFENTRYVPEDYYNSLSKTRKPQKGDVLYTLVGSYGIPVVVDSDKSFCFQRHMGLLKPRKVDTYYLWYQLQSDVIYQKATAIATGTAQLTVPIKGLRKIEIAVPTMEEQQEIVRILNDVLGKERKLQEDITGIIEQVESTRKSILAKAFRGELGTNDPEDECAIELLKGILDDTREN